MQNRRSLHSDESGSRLQENEWAKFRGNFPGTKGGWAEKRGAHTIKLWHTQLAFKFASPAFVLFCLKGLKSFWSPLNFVTDHGPFQVDFVLV